MRTCDLVIHFSSGYENRLPFSSAQMALHAARNNISYTGDRVKRVEIDNTPSGGGVRAVWAADWDDASKAAALRDTP